LCRCLVCNAHWTTIHPLGQHVSAEASIGSCRGHCAARLSVLVSITQRGLPPGEGLISRQDFVSVAPVGMWARQLVHCTVRFTAQHHVQSSAIMAGSLRRTDDTHRGNAGVGSDLICRSARLQAPELLSQRCQHAGRRSCWLGGHPGLRAWTHRAWHDTLRLHGGLSQLCFYKRRRCCRHDDARSACTAQRRGRSGGA
jgi:hypothetical protein